MGTCKYLMAKSEGNIHGLPPFAVYSKNYERGVPGIAYVLWVEIEYDNLLIHIQKTFDSKTAPIIVTVSKKALFDSIQFIVIISVAYNDLSFKFYSEATQFFIFQVGKLMREYILRSHRTAAYVIRNNQQLLYELKP